MADIWKIWVDLRIFCRRWLRRLVYFSIAGGCLFLITTAATGDFNEQRQEDPSASWNTTAIEEKIHDEVNQRRSTHGSGELRYDSELSQIAENHSQNMATNGFYSHKSPSGMRFPDRYDAAGYNCHVNNPGGVDSAGAENIDKTYLNTEVLVNGKLKIYENESEAAIGVVNQWMGSPEHREILLRDIWNTEGIGVAIIERKKGLALYVTQNFC